MTQAAQHPTAPAGSTPSGPGPFITRVVKPHADGRFRVSTSRRARKRLLPVVVGHSGTQVLTLGGWRRFWAPSRLAWWVAILFLIGSALFALGGVGACLGRTPAGTLNLEFFIGSLFFTAAATVQWLEAINGDVTAPRGSRKRWRWMTWRPRNLGYLACMIQFVGTLLFNANTGDVFIPGLSAQDQTLLIWWPNVIGCLCFLVASYLGVVEVGHRFFPIELNHLSWWITIINLAGSVAFAVSAVYARLPGEAAAWSSALWTALGALCFFVGAYLLLPEMFDESR